MPIVLLTAVEKENTTFTREEGLEQMEALIDEKPQPDNKQDVMRFLETFKAKKGKWHVDGQDLRNAYMRKYNMFALLKHWNATRRYCPNYKDYL